MRGQANLQFLLVFMLAVSLVSVQFGPAMARDSSGSRLGKSVSDYQRTVREGVAIGAIVGAGIGAIIGSRNGGRGAASGAVIGALLGGALGGIGGKSVADNKARYVARENRLDAEIAHARASNRRLSSLISVSRNLVSQRQQEVASLRKRGGSDKLNEQKTLLRELQQDRKDVSAALSAAQKSRNSLKAGIAAYQKSGALRSEANTTNGAISSLQKDRAKLDQMISGLK